MMGPSKGDAGRIARGGTYGTFVAVWRASRSSEARAVKQWRAGCLLAIGVSARLGVQAPFVSPVPYPRCLAVGCSSHPGRATARVGVPLNVGQQRRLRSN